MSNQQFLPMEMPPGVVAKATGNKNSSNWKEVNLVRWNGEKMNPLTGWEKTVLTFPFASKLRRIHTWTDNAGIKRTAYLCEGHFYIEEGGTLSDLSPTAALTLPGADTGPGGYGDDDYGEGAYGTPRPTRTRTKIVAPSYSMDNWGEELLFMTSADGRLLRWQPASPLTKANAVPSAPTNNRTFVITPERYIILFGAGGDFRRLRWCNQTDYSAWTPGTGSTAGGYFIEPSAMLVGALVVADGVLFWTVKKMYMLRYGGVPYIYSYGDPLSGDALPVSAAAIVETAVGAIWHSESGFWRYQGGSIVPLDCSILSWITDDYHEFLNRYESCIVNVNNKSEIWTFFTSKNADDNDKVAIYNYRNGWWSQGKMSRCCGGSANYDSFPLMSDGTYVYKHESGTLYPDAPELPWAETFVINVNSGSDLSIFRQMLPDIGADHTAVNFKFYYKDQRSGKADNVSIPSVMRADGYLDIFISGRDFRFRVTQAAANSAAWTFGQSMVDIHRRGKR